MLIAELRERVLRANLELFERKLALYTWGNASGIDREAGLVAIKPSGVPYHELTPDKISVVRLADGERVEGLQPSSDTPTHLGLYRAWPGVGGVTHTHSTHATIWAQACRGIPCFGTTHADYFHGEVLCTDCMAPDEIATDYEANTAACIVRRFKGLDPLDRPAVLVANHGPFTWGADVEEALYHAGVLEEVARMGLETLRLNPDAQPISKALLNKHFRRKHGPDAYYGQARPELDGR